VGSEGKAKQPGSLRVLRDEMFTSIFDKPIPSGKIIYADEEISIGLSR